MSSFKDTDRVLRSPLVLIKTLRILTKTKLREFFKTTHSSLYLVTFFMNIDPLP